MQLNSTVQLSIQYQLCLDILPTFFINFNVTHSPLEGLKMHKKFWPDSFALHDATNDKNEI